MPLQSLNGFKTLPLPDTTSNATRYLVELGTDGIIKTKLLADVKTEIVTKAAVEAVLTGAITSHTHAYQPADATLTSLAAVAATAASDFIVATGADAWTKKTLAETKALLITKAAVEAVLTGTIESHYHNMSEKTGVGSISEAGAITIDYAHNLFTGTNTAGSTNFPNQYGQTWLFAGNGSTRDFTLFKPGAETAELYWGRINATRNAVSTFYQFWHNGNIDFDREASGYYAAAANTAVAKTFDHTFAGIPSVVVTNKTNQTAIFRVGSVTASGFNLYCSAQNIYYDWIAVYKP